MVFCLFCTLLSVNCLFLSVNCKNARIISLKPRCAYTGVVYDLMTHPDMSIKVERKLHDMRMSDRIVRVRSTEAFVWHLLSIISCKDMLFLIQNFFQNFVNTRRICFSFHGFHGLSHQKSDRFFLAAFVIGHRLWILRNNLLDSGLKCTFIVHRFQSMFFDIGFRINILFENLLKDLNKESNNYKTYTVRFI